MLILNENTSDYQTLLEKSKKTAMKMKRLRNLGTEIFKTVNNVNPSFMKNIFTSKENGRVRPNNIVIYQVIYSLYILYLWLLARTLSVSTVLNPQ